MIVIIKGEKVASKDCVTRTFRQHHGKPCPLLQRVTPSTACPSCGGTHCIKALAEEYNYGDNPKGRYLGSLQKATNSKANQPQVLAQGCVSLAEFEGLRDQVSIQQDQIDGLLDAIEALQRAKGEDTDEDI